MGRTVTVELAFLAERLQVVGCERADDRVAVFSQLEQSGRVKVIGCDHTLRHTQSWAEQQGLDAQRVLESVSEFGGFCDCEVLFNVTPDKFAW